MIEPTHKLKQPDTFLVAGWPVPLPVVLAGPAVLLGLAMAFLAYRLPRFWSDLSGRDPELYASLLSEGVAFQVNGLSVMAGITAALLLVFGVLGLKIRSRMIRSCLRKSYGLVVLWFVLSTMVTHYATGIILSQGLAVGGVEQDRVTLFFLSWSLLWPLTPLPLIALWAHIQNLRERSIIFYDGAFHPGRTPWIEQRLGDRIMENLRVHGKDPRFRKSSYSSMLTHLLIIVIIPVLVQMVGCVDRYTVPEGSGEPMAAVVQVVQREVQEQQQLILRPDAPIIFDIPDLDDSKLLDEVMEMSELAYQVDPHAGRLGEGGGQEGGWPDGMADGVVRFIRLEYNGPGWDNAMGPGEDSDLNFLRTFGRLTGLRTSNRNESHGVRNLGRYAKGYAPPFVFMTGHAHIRLSSAELQVLREYLNGGGMLFASAGSAQWHNEFRNLMRQLYPDDNLRVIADDDPIFRQPYYFANGAPPLWHHGGRQAMGIRRDGRWTVFYHPGDIQDAWRTGHSGLSPELAQRAAQLGVNVIYYAFTNYLEETKEFRK